MCRYHGRLEFRPVQVSSLGGRPLSWSGVLDCHTWRTQRSAPGHRFQWVLEELGEKLELMSCAILADTKIRIPTNILQRCLELYIVGKREILRQDSKPKDQREEVGCNQRLRILQIEKLLVPKRFSWRLTFQMKTYMLQDGFSVKSHANGEHFGAISKTMFLDCKPSGIALFNRKDSSGKCDVLQDDIMKKSPNMDVEHPLFWDCVCKRRVGLTKTYNLEKLHWW